MPGWINSVVEGGNGNGWIEELERGYVLVRFSLVAKRAHGSSESPVRRVTLHYFRKIGQINVLDNFQGPTMKKVLVLMFQIPIVCLSIHPKGSNAAEWLRFKFPRYLEPPSLCCLQELLTFRFPMAMTLTSI